MLWRRLLKVMFLIAVSAVAVLACQENPVGVDRGGNLSWRPVTDCPIAERDTSAAGDDSTGVISPGGVVFPNYHRGASWHRNGLIVYANQGTSCVDKNGNYSIDLSLQGIWILDPLRGTKNRIVDRGRYPSWSPDGKQIVFEYFRDIYIVEITDGSVTKLTDQGRNFFPSWSPDGQWIVHDRTDPPFQGIWLVRPDASEHHRVPKVDIIQTPRREPSWSPDGKWILHTAHTNEGSDLFEISVDGLQVRRIAKRIDGEDAPEYSRDGKEIVFQSLGLRSVPFRAQIWTMNVNGTRQRQQTFCGGLDPSWSPDGTQIVYTKSLQDNSSEDGVLFIIDLRNGLEKQITFQPECKD